MTRLPWCRRDRRAPRWSGHRRSRLPSGPFTGRRHRRPGVRIVSSGVPPTTRPWSSTPSSAARRAAARPLGGHRLVPGEGASTSRDVLSDLYTDLRLRRSGPCSRRPVTWLATADDAARADVSRPPHALPRSTEPAAPRPGVHAARPRRRRHRGGDDLPSDHRPQRPDRSRAASDREAALREARRLRGGTTRRPSVQRRAQADPSPRARTDARCAADPHRRRPEGRRPRWPDRRRPVGRAAMFTTRRP